MDEYKVFVSNQSAEEVVSSLKKEIEGRGMAIFAHINHGREAEKASLNLGEEHLLIFGDPKVGTFLMQENRLIGIELPLKILVFSAEGKTQIAVPNVLLWKERFQLKTQAPIIDKMSGLLDQLVKVGEHSLKL